MNKQVMEEFDPRQDWEHYTDMPVGEVLRRTRIYYGQSIEDVSAVLRIRVSQLAALEEGRIDLLPGRVYAIGFVRAYAEYLRLDADKVVHLFKTQSVGTGNRPALHFPVPASESKSPNAYILASSFIALVVVVLTFSLWSGRDQKQDEIIPVVPVLLDAEVAAWQADMPLEAAFLASIETAAGTEGPEILAALKEPESRIVINVVGNSWVEIRDVEGKVVLSRILKAGDRYLVPPAPGHVLDTGNVGALEFLVDGTPVSKLGESGDIRRGVKLDPDLFVKSDTPDTIASENIVSHEP